MIRITAVLVITILSFAAVAQRVDTVALSPKAIERIQAIETQQAELQKQAREFWEVYLDAKGVKPVAEGDSISFAQPNLFIIKRKKK